MPATGSGSRRPFSTILSRPGRSVTSIRPSGRNAIPHGVSRPRATTSSLNACFSDRITWPSGSTIVGGRCRGLGFLLADQHDQLPDLLLREHVLEGDHRRSLPAVANGLDDVRVVAAECPDAVDQAARRSALEVPAVAGDAMLVVDGPRLHRRIARPAPGPRVARRALRGLEPRAPAGGGGQGPPHDGRPSHGCFLTRFLWSVRADYATAFRRRAWRHGRTSSALWLREKEYRRRPHRIDGGSCDQPDAPSIRPCSSLAALLALAVLRKEGATRPQVAHPTETTSTVGHHHDVASSSDDDATPPPVWRSARWGMTKREVLGRLSRRSATARPARRLRTAAAGVEHPEGLEQRRDSGLRGRRHDVPSLVRVRIGRAQPCSSVRREAGGQHLRRPSKSCSPRSIPRHRSAAARDPRSRVRR